MREKYENLLVVDRNTPKTCHSRAEGWESSLLRQILRVFNKLDLRPSVEDDGEPVVLTNQKPPVILKPLGLGIQLIKELLGLYFIHTFLTSAGSPAFFHQAEQAGRLKLQVQSAPLKMTANR
ncbi:MAG: hypothetical protein E7Z89_03980 [Cyanobacteria bacterium SIG28]|nr:hypothetical protein [Cyanobacteria bacterium SIG28]